MPPLDITPYPFITIAIPVHNERKSIARKLENTFDVEYPGLFEVIVIDDGDDGTREIVGEFADMNDLQDRLKFIHLEKRSGKAHALNIALSMAHGKILVSTDANALVGKDSIRAIVHSFLAEDKIACVSGVRTVADPGTLVEKGEAIYWEIDTYLRGKQSEYSIVRTSIGELSAYRTEIVKSVGGFPESAVSEDFEMTVLLAARGYKVRLCREATVSEPGPATVRDLYERKARTTYGLLRGLLNNASLIRKLDIRTSIVIVLSVIVPCLAVLLLAPVLLLGLVFAKKAILLVLAGAVVFAFVLAVWTRSPKGVSIFGLYLLILYFAILGGVYRLIFKGQAFPWRRLESTRR